MDIHQSMVDRKITPLDLVNETLRKIKAKASEYNVFITVSETEAIEHAKTLEQELIDGKVRGLLH